MRRVAVSLPDLSLPNVDSALIDPPTGSRFAGAGASTHAKRFLLLYGSLRERSYSKLLTFEAARLLIAMGGEVRVFDPAGLSLPDSAPETHPKVQELREAAAWAEGMVWTSPERHGAMTGIMKAQIDWIPLNVGAVRPTQGKTLAVMEVSGDSQSFNAVNQLRVLGRWMRMITIPNQSSVAKAFLEFDDVGRMKPSAYYERVVDVMEELVKFKPQALPVCDRSAHCGDDNPPFHADQPFQLSLTTCRPLGQPGDLPEAVPPRAGARAARAH